MDDMPRLGDLLGETGARLGFDRAAEAGALWSRWEEIVGEAIAEHAEPSSLRGGVLKVRAVSAAWATEIGYLADHIKRSANEALGSPIVTEVQVWTAPGPVRRRRAEVPVEGDPGAAPKGSGGDPEGDPEEALARARAAWLRTGSRGAAGGRSGGPRKPENPW